MPDDYSRHRLEDALRNLKVMCDRNTELQSRIDAAVKELRQHVVNMRGGVDWAPIPDTKRVIALLTGESVLTMPLDPQHELAELKRRVEALELRVRTLETGDLP